MKKKVSLRTYNQRQQKWIHGTVSSEPDDKPEDTPEVPEQPKEIKFYLQRCHLKGGELEEYTAVEGMTWAEFCDSEYNTDGWYAYDPETDGDNYVETFWQQDFDVQPTSEIWGWIQANELQEDHSFRVNRDSKIIADYVYEEAFDVYQDFGGGLGG